MIIPLYILYATPLFHGEQLGSGKSDETHGFSRRRQGGG
jgi:hypothetical protein